MRAVRGPRAPRDEAAERAKIEARTKEEWIDEGELRAQAEHATRRAASDRGSSRRERQVDPDASSLIASEVHDARRAARLAGRLAQAQDALDRERFEDARRIASSLSKELPNVAPVHEVLGLSAYRTGKWRQAATELEAAQALHPSVELLPVLADVYRAQQRWADVERVWSEVREISPAPEIIAEARIVAAGSAADRGDLQAALRIMGRAADVPKRVRDHHLRQWYVIGDLHDRAGDALEAARFFELIASHDREFVDVTDRLRALGR